MAHIRIQPWTAASPFGEAFLCMDPRLPFLHRNEKACQSVIVKEDKQTYTISFEIPGVKVEDMSLAVGDNALRFKGCRKVSKDVGNVSESKFEYRLSLGDDVDVEHEISATLKEGTLEVVIPKKSKPQKHEPRVIMITEGPTEKAVMEGPASNGGDNSKLQELKPPISRL